MLLDLLGVGASCAVMFSRRPFQTVPCLGEWSNRVLGVSFARWVGADQNHWLGDLGWRVRLGRHLKNAQDMAGAVRLCLAIPHRS